MDHAILQRERALLEVARSIVSHRDLKALFRDLARLLRRVVEFDFLNLILHDPATQTMRLHVLETAQPIDESQWPPGFPVDETPTGWVWRQQEPLEIPDLSQESRWPGLMALMREHGVQSCCWVPLTMEPHRLGAICFGRTRPHSYGQDETEFMQRVAEQVAVAVDNSLHHEQAAAYQKQLQHERDRLGALLNITNALVLNLEPRELFHRITECLREAIPHDYASVALFDPPTGQLRLRALDFPASRGLIEEEMLLPLEGSPSGLAFQLAKPVIVTSENADRFSSEIMRRLRAEGIESGCSVPLITRNRTLGALNLARRQDRAFSDDDVALLGQVASQIAIAIENAMAFQKIEELKDKLAEEKLYLEDEIRTEHDFGEIIGESAAFKAVLKKTETVAPTDATVLILGETGTGKELIARAIHELSPRCERTFVKLNCAAIPTGLLESELFGHEKGAFTGAIALKVGRFELAHQGTLFLDEVGDIPLELQPKLLRALQEREFERLGGTRSIRVDVRVVAATNRDLAAMVSEREFRGDLYYRLNVFPIVIPPLRERPEDIPLLVRYFTQKHSRQLDRRIESIPAEAMEALMRYTWPGNVRELENFVERAVILSTGRVLRVALSELRASAEAAAAGLTLEDAEREHILRVLRETNWRLGGAGGAAERLGMKRTTVQSRMKKLGIRRPV